MLACSIETTWTAQMASVAMAQLGHTNGSCRDNSIASISMDRSIGLAMEAAVRERGSYFEWHQAICYEQCNKA
jgi:hypothetical protein